MDEKTTPTFSTAEDQPKTFEEKAQARAEKQQTRGSNVTPRSEIRGLGTDNYWTFSKRLDAWYNRTQRK